MKYEQNKIKNKISQVRMFMKSKNIETLKLSLVILMLKNNHSKFIEATFSNNLCSEV